MPGAGAVNVEKVDLNWKTALVIIGGILLLIAAIFFIVKKAFSDTADNIKTGLSGLISAPVTAAKEVKAAISTQVDKTVSGVGYLTGYEGLSTPSGRWLSDAWDRITGVAP